MVTLGAPAVSDHVALAEIELCGELMIAASAAIGERLSADRIDEVLDVKAGTDRTTVPRQGHHQG
ncbi:MULTISPECIES: hypothetical protein [unclassified Streptomyces]|uniref:hypothetical protein n=1 Tax=Streptomyces TaxID=1883 RepID=UPI00036FF8C0|nr:hypothetical protein [Streptomyces sp. SID4920]MYX67145.1 hypothetical protein [Streptomyces sp. SID8373]NED12053.1 hypothetical protein [Streptomyces sp. SID9124]RAJ68647.1 hypothetical protein K388_01398 [Streptomyces sp. KhCrAH-43]SED02296.1 hypothetical protein SAMN05216483_2922 [Streptomyces sp. 2131.1]